jgi:hypothetical protein
MANPTASDIQAAINAIDAQIAQLQKGAVFDGRTRARVLELQQERDELARALPLAGGAQTQQGGDSILDALVAQMMAEGGTDPLGAGTTKKSIGSFAGDLVGKGLDIMGWPQSGVGQNVGAGPQGGDSFFNPDGSLTTLGMLYFDVSPLDAQKFGLDTQKFQYGQGQDALSQQNWEAQFGYGQTQDAQAQQNWLQQWQAQQEQIKAQQAYQQQQLAQAWALAQAQLAQQQQEMAAGIGQQVAGLQSQAWSQALPYVLPSGTQHAPGYGYGGPVNVLANIAGAAYKPQKLAVSNPPSADQMMAWISQAMQQFGG